jgi:hypothetical protein
MLENPTSDGSTFHELANLIYPDCWEHRHLRERRYRYFPASTSAGI